MTEIQPPLTGMTDPSHDLLCGSRNFGTNFSYQNSVDTLYDVDVTGTVSYATATILVSVISTNQRPVKTRTIWVK